MNDKIVESLKNIETHADVLMAIPASEQHIGNIQAVVSIALLEIKRCLEAISGERDRLALVANICRPDKHKDQIGDILRVCEAVRCGALLGDWRDISTAPKDGTRFIARLLIPATYQNRWEMKDRYSKKITWWGKTSHVPLYGWCHGFVENVDLWNPTAWKPLKAKSPNEKLCRPADSEAGAQKGQSK